MSEEQPSLHIDTDWKKQAQEEKRRLAEQEKQRSPAAPPPPMPGQTASVAATEAAPTESRRASTGGRTSGAARGAPGEREAPPANFATLVQSIVTQILFYLGDLAPRGGEPMLNLDMAKHQIDMLGVLDEKTQGNLTDEERRMLDAALYETRMRYVAMASQMVS